MNGPGDNRLAVLAAEVQAADGRFRRSAEQAAAAAIEAGQKLIEAKSLVAHGGWLPWLRDRVAMSERTATRYMRLARSGMDIRHVADLGIRAASEAIGRAPAPYEQHPIGTCYPPMTKAEFSDLCASIAHMGLLMPITLFEGRVLDGWQRELACRKTGVPPRYTNFVGDWDGALAFTISYNIRRQHLNQVAAGSGCRGLVIAAAG